MRDQGAGEDEIEIEDLTIELPADYGADDAQAVAREVVGQLPELLREHLGALDED
jgi:hypothetical protein